MWDEKSFPLTGGHIQRHHCVVFPGNLRCCATADAVQDIIRTVAVVHALHPEPDPQVFLMEHRSLHVHKLIRNNTTKLVGDILLRLGAETREDIREKVIHASFGGGNCVANVLDVRRNFKFQRGVFGICCDVEHQNARG